MKDQLNIIEEITDREYENCLILTFNSSLIFYEQIILKELERKGCTNNVIIMDQGQYDLLINNEKNNVNYCGSHYLCEGMQLRGAFHPKIILLTNKNSGKVMIGSGNTTFPGLGDNLEIFSKFEYDDEQREYLSIFQEILAYFETLHNAIGLTPSPAIVRRIKALKETTPWITSTAENRPNEIFLHNLERPILDQIIDYAPHNINDIVLAAPYFDEHLSVLQALQSKYPKANIIIATQTKNTNFPIDYFLGHKSSFPRVSLHKVAPSEGGHRRFHAKLIYLANDTKEIIFSGSANISRSALQTKARERNAEAGILVTQSSHNRLAGIWRSIVEKKEISKREELEINDAVGNDLSLNKYEIRIKQAYLEGPFLEVRYESDLLSPAELFLNGTLITKIRLRETGIIKEEVKKYFDSHPDEECFYVQIKCKNQQSNLIWATNIFIKRNIEKKDLNRQLNSLTPYIKDLSYINWMIELSPDIRQREDKGHNFAVNFKLVNQENAGEESELPEQLYVVEEKPEYTNFRDTISNRDKFAYDSGMLSEILNNLLRTISGIPTKKTRSSDNSEINNEINGEDEEGDAEINIGEMISNKIDRIIDKNLRNLEIISKIDAIATMRLMDFQIFLLWSLKGIEISINEIEDSISIDTERYMEASTAILKRLWKKTSSLDFLESNKREDHAYLALTQIYPLCLCVISFNMWLLFNRDEFFEDSELKEKELMGIFLKIREKLNSLPADMVESLLSDKKVKQIAEKINEPDGFNMSDQSLIKIIRSNINVAVLEKAIIYANDAKLAELLSKKELELEKLDRKLMETMAESARLKNALNESGKRSILGFNLADSRTNKIKDKIEEAKNCKFFLEKHEYLPIKRIVMSQKILNFFNLNNNS